MGDGLTRSYSASLHPAQHHVPTREDDRELEMLLLLNTRKNTSSQNFIVDRNQSALGDVLSLQTPSKKEPLA